jgi:exopolysaccharide production protein ExoQ
MSPSIALLIWLIVLFALFHYDPARDSSVSAASWVPLAWMFIMGSRLPSQWFGGLTIGAAEAYEDGNEFDRGIYLLLIALAIGILMSRSLPWKSLAAHNLALTLLLTYTLLSVVWSDYAFVAFKRWIRDLGNYLMILVVLSEPEPVAAVQTLLRRFSYLLVPLSIVLIKYYPELGKGYDGWTGVAFFLGATTTKNMLGVMCLVSGIFCFWDITRRWPDRRRPRTRRILVIDVAFIVMTLWLLNLADSATSRVCLLLGCLVVIFGHSHRVQRASGLVKLLIPSMLGLYLLLDLVFNVKDALVQLVGRDPTLTGRTEVWNDALGLTTNPLLGTGYESFWLGERLQFMWAKYPFRPNQAHNGYLEVYLNLGVLGLIFLGGFLISTYRIVWRRMPSSQSFAALGLALWSILLVYNGTEAAFKSQLLWFTFLLIAIAVPTPQQPFAEARLPEVDRAGVD